MAGSGKMPEELLTIGEILKPRGVHGEVKVRVLCSDIDDFIDCLEAGETFLWRFRPGKDSVPVPSNPKVLFEGGKSVESSLTALPGLVEIESVRFHAGFALVKPVGINSVEEAEKLRGLMIGIRSSMAPETDEDSFYVHELEGAEVVGSDGVKLGTVVSVEENPAHDQLLVKPVESDRKPFLIPLIAEFVKRVSVEEKRIEVELPAGLIESQQ